MKPEAHYVCEEIPPEGAPWRQPATTEDCARLSARAALSAVKARRVPRAYLPAIIRVVDTLTGRAVVVYRVA